MRDELPKLAEGKWKMRNGNWKMTNDMAQRKEPEATNTPRALFLESTKDLLVENVRAVLWTTRAFTVTSNGQRFAIA